VRSNILWLTADNRGAQESTCGNYSRVVREALLGYPFSHCNVLILRKLVKDADITLLGGFSHEKAKFFHTLSVFLYDESS
jgi:hypothetical protein